MKRNNHLNQESDLPRNQKDDSKIKQDNEKEIPNENTGARPPQEEDYDFEEDPQAEKINNEKKDEYQEKNKNR
jgi:hypothetical protein